MATRKKKAGKRKANRKPRAAKARRGHRSARRSRSRTEVDGEPYTYQGTFKSKTEEA